MISTTDFMNTVKTTATVMMAVPTQHVTTTRNACPLCLAATSRSLPRQVVTPWTRYPEISKQLLDCMRREVVENFPPYRRDGFVW